MQQILDGNCQPFLKNYLSSSNFQNEWPQLSEKIIYQSSEVPAIVDSKVMSKDSDKNKDIEINMPNLKNDIPKDEINFDKIEEDDKNGIYIF